MIKILIAFFSFPLLISCNQNKAETKIFNQVDTTGINYRDLPVDSMRFDFAVTRRSKIDSLIKVRATLHNLYKDTVYFLTWTCDGLIYDFKYDTAKLNLFPNVLCNASFPMVEKIPPNDKLNFDADFVLKTKEKSINLGYDFYRIEKDFDIKADFHKIIKYQEDKRKTILTTTEKFIN